MKKEKVIGIMGGMGPEAGADIFLDITAATHAKCDEEHLHIIMDSNPKMPSRQDAILHGGESPVPAMVATAQNLVRAGADVIIIGANTAHYFYDAVSAQVGVPFLHIIDETVKEMARVCPAYTPWACCPPTARSRRASITSPARSSAWRCLTSRPSCRASCTSP